MYEIDFENKSLVQLYEIPFELNFWNDRNMGVVKGDADYGYCGEFKCRVYHKSDINTCLTIMEYGICCSENYLFDHRGNVYNTETKTDENIKIEIDAKNDLIWYSNDFYITHKNYTVTIVSKTKKRILELLFYPHIEKIPTIPVFNFKFAD